MSGIQKPFILSSLYKSNFYLSTANYKDIIKEIQHKNQYNKTIMHSFFGYPDVIIKRICQVYSVIYFANLGEYFVEFMK